LFEEVQLRSNWRRAIPYAGVALPAAFIAHSLSELDAAGVQAVGLMSTVHALMFAVAVAVGFLVWIIKE
jgi:hypothetical protein